MATDTGRQIKQMINFIMQEAHEKVNEIRIKTDHDFNLEKQNLVQSGKLKVQEEYAQKEKDLEVQHRVSRSAAIGEARVTTMKARDNLLEILKQETLQQLANFCKSPEYSNFIRKLILQGLVKIEEQTVELQVRAEDRAICEKELPAAVEEFKRLMTAGGYIVDPKVTISPKNLPAKAISGGLVLTALNNRIVLDQSVEERLLIAYSDVMPSVRYGLFQQSSA